MIPWRGPNELLQDQALDIDEGRNLLGILALQVGQQTRQVEVHMTLLSLARHRGTPGMV